MSAITYLSYKFEEITKDQIMMYHRSRYANGIVSIDAGKAATVQIVTSNEKGYSDVFKEGGDLLSYSQSDKKSDNKILDKLSTSSPVHVYIYGKDTDRYWSCGVYNIVDRFSWGWNLSRIPSK